MLSVPCGLVLVLPSPEALGGCEWDECPAFLAFSAASSLILAFPLPLLPEGHQAMPSVQSRSGKVCEQSVIVLHFLPLIPFHALPRFPVVLPHRSLACVASCSEQPVCTPCSCLGYLGGALALGGTELHLRWGKAGINYPGAVGAGAIHCILPGFY